MTITVGGTSITFNDATTQTTAPVNTNANVNSITAGTGISVSASTGAVTISATGGGTVTSVATGNGLQGGTITTSGTLSVAAPGANTVGSYIYGIRFIQTNQVNITTTFGADYAAGNGNLQVRAAAYGNYGTQSLISGTWRCMCGTTTISTNNCCPNGAAGVYVRVS